MKVSIIGATGYGGAELVRLISNHPHMEIAGLHSSSRTGHEYAAEYPHFMYKVEEMLQEINPEKMAEESDLVFLAAPNGVSAELAPQFQSLNTRVVDLSGDLRIKNRDDYRDWYKMEPAPEEILSSAVYGLPEWNRENTADAKIIANPGCFPTAALLGLAPLLQNYDSIEDIIIDAKTGVSGAGRSLSAGAHFSEVNENFKIYKVNRHQHTPEIEQQLQAWNPKAPPVSFSAHLVPMTRGIMTTMYVKGDGPGDAARLWSLYKETYEHEPFVRVHPNGSFPCTRHVYGSNYCDIGTSYDERTGRIMIISVIDNLVKGAAGQAVQNANIMFGFKEEDGLLSLPLYP
ncbi:N-acetyl-gamma-glutamyl-phosphate reductase [Peribacillus sp. SCS-37]|uniref:N-acetyl-gamma-glutamyl-phosphate reductase n=1 Tax=Paraperibacillus esterisolvens TaxID=3115296 RepID=UPI00390606D2